MLDTSKVNLRLVRGQIAQVRRSLRRLRALAALPRVVFVSNSDNFAIAEHHLLRSLDAIFDVGRHIIARCGLGSAQDYADVSRILGEGRRVIRGYVPDSPRPRKTPQPFGPLLLASERR